MYTQKSVFEKYQEKLRAVARFLKIGELNFVDETENGQGLISTGSIKSTEPYLKFTFSQNWRTYQKDPDKWTLEAAIFCPIWGSEILKNYDYKGTFNQTRDAQLIAAGLINKVVNPARAKFKELLQEANNRRAEILRVRAFLAELTEPLEEPESLIVKDSYYIQYDSRSVKITPYEAHKMSDGEGYNLEISIHTPEALKLIFKIIREDEKLFEEREKKREEAYKKNIEI